MAQFFTRPLSITTFIEVATGHGRALWVAEFGRPESVDLSLNVIEDGVFRSSTFEAEKQMVLNVIGRRYWSSAPDADRITLYPNLDEYLRDRATRERANAERQGLAPATHQLSTPKEH